MGEPSSTVPYVGIPMFIHHEHGFLNECNNFLTLTLSRQYSIDMSYGIMNSLNSRPYPVEKHYLKKKRFAEVFPKFDWMKDFMASRRYKIPMKHVKTCPKKSKKQTTTSKKVVEKQIQHGLNKQNFNRVVKQTKQ